MNISPDIYDYLTNFADDKTVLSMLSVNKKFNDDMFFKRVLERRYPFLLNFKKSDETYKNLYLRMIYAIAKLQEEYDIPYIPDSEYDPDFFLRNRILNYRRKYYVYSELAHYAGKSGNLEIVKKIATKGPDLKNSLFGAARHGHMAVVKYLIEEANVDDSYEINYAMVSAGAGGHLDIVKYLVTKGADNFPDLLTQGVSFGHCDIIEYAIEQGVSDDGVRFARSYNLNNNEHVVECIDNAVRKKQKR